MDLFFGAGRRMRHGEALSEQRGAARSFRERCGQSAAKPTMPFKPTSGSLHRSRQQNPGPPSCSAPLPALVPALVTCPRVLRGGRCQAGRCTGSPRSARPLRFAACQMQPGFLGSLGGVHPGYLVPWQRGHGLSRGSAVLVWCFPGCEG